MIDQDDPSQNYYLIDDNDESNSQERLNLLEMINLRPKDGQDQIDCSRVLNDIDYALFWTKKIEVNLQKNSQSDMQHASHQQHQGSLIAAKKLLTNGCKKDKDGQYTCMGHIVRRLHEDLGRAAQFLGQEAPTYLNILNNAKISDMWNKKSAVTELKNA